MNGWLEHTTRAAPTRPSGRLGDSDITLLSSAAPNIYIYIGLV